MRDLKKLFPATLRRLREQRGLSREWVAESLGIETRELERWETGASPVPYGPFFDLADLYDLDLGGLDDLVGRTPPSRPDPPDVIGITPRQVARQWLERPGESFDREVEDALTEAIAAVFRLAALLRFRREAASSPPDDPAREEPN